jgi:HEAT repeat protein
MARLSFEEKLARLKKLAEGFASDDAIREIRQALSGANSVLAAKAAAVAAKLGLLDLAPDLISAFNRHLQDPVKSDPGCRAKIAAIEALNALDYAEADVFLRGIRHIQQEYSYGSPVDTADLLRAACAFGLYRLGHPELLCELAFLLMDREPAARRAAIKVLTESGRESCEMMLRMKVLQGDREPEILGDCFSGLMAIAPARSLRFVEPFLSAEDPGIAEEAALAIGGSRLPEAYALLRDVREREIPPSFKRMLLLPIALTRCEEAFTMLLGVVQGERPENAKAAVQALSIYCDNPERREQIHKAVFVRNDAAVSEAYEKGIGRDFAHS